VTRLARPPARSRDAVRVASHAAAGDSEEDQASSTGARVGHEVAEPPRRRSLLWRAFSANLLVLCAAGATLALAPVTIHTPIRTGELIVLVALLGALALVSFALISHAVAPLRRLTELIAEIDPRAPGRRAASFEGAAAEVALLAQAFNRMLDRLETERRESAARALEAQEGERLRVARELHDEVGQTLTAVALRAERAAADGDDQTQALLEISEAVQTSLDDLRRIARRLRPEALDDLGLVNALIALCNRVSRQGDIAIRRNLASDLPAIPPEIELVVYRVAQEALTNVLRHASATRVTVSLTAPEGRVALIVTDNGLGLPNNAEQRAGIAGMRERALLVGGEFSIAPGPDGGVEVGLRLP
jgi:two-component system sensor histidine kinase UhpB